MAEVQQYEYKSGYLPKSGLVNIQSLFQVSKKLLYIIQQFPLVIHPNKKIQT